MAESDAALVTARSAWRALAQQAVELAETHALRGWCRSMVAREFNAEIVVLPGGVTYPAACDTGGPHPLIALSSAVEHTLLELPYLLHAAGHIMATRLTGQPILCMNPICNVRVERIAWSLAAFLAFPHLAVCLIQEEPEHADAFGSNYDVTGSLLDLRVVLQGVLDTGLTAATLEPVLAAYTVFFDDLRQRAAPLVAA